MTIATEKISSTVTNRLGDGWKLKSTSEEGKEESFSSDTVINAYLQGRKVQVAEDEKAKTKELKKNILKAMNLSSSFSNILKDKKIKCKHVLLRPETITEFESIFIVSKEDYISPQFEGIYKLAISKKAEINSDTFHFSYTFIPYSESLNKGKLLSNGYVLEYVK